MGFYAVYAYAGFRTGYSWNELKLYGKAYAFLVSSY